MYVDDNIIISNDRTGMDAFKKSMHDKFEIVDKKDIETYLGIQVERDRTTKTLKIHQEGYVNDVLAAMGINIDDKLKYDTPLPAGISLMKNTGNPYELDVYRSLIGSLIYLSQWTRIDIAYAVSALAAHMSNPSRDHHVALKHLLHYLHGTRNRGITYHGYDIHGINQIYGFVDADFAGDKETRRSRSGYVIMMNGGCISWRSRLQTVSASSTTDAEIYAATAAIKEIGYLQDALRRIGLPQAVEGETSKGTILYEDNEATTAIARTAAHREATKHLAIARSFLRYHQENGTVYFVDCFTTAQVADFLTKSLGAKSFKDLTSEAMGETVKLSVLKYARRDWKQKYSEDLEKKKVEMESRLQGEGFTREEAKLGYMRCITNKEDIDGNSGLRDEARGGMKKVELHQALKRVELIHCNAMRVPSMTSGPNTVICSDIDDFLRYEQHRFCLEKEYKETEMKVENKYYTEAVV